MTAKTLLQRRMNERVCVQWPDNGRQVLIEPGQMPGVGGVYLLVTLDVAREERSLFVVRQGDGRVEEALALEEGYREMRQNHGFGAFHSRNWNAIYGHFTFVFLSLLLTIAIRRFTEGLAGQTLGWVKEHYLDAVVELRETADTLIVLLSRGFLRNFGLFQLDPGIGYVDW